MRLCNIATKNQDFFLNLLELLDDYPVMKHLIMQEASLNTKEIAQMLSNQVCNNVQLAELDISHCVFMPHTFKEFCACLAFDASSKSLRFLDLSHINVQGIKFGHGYFSKERIGKGKKQETVEHNHVEEIIENIAVFVRDSINIQVLKLNGMNLGESIKPIIQEVASLKSENLLSLHLNDNGFTRETRSYIFKKLKINTHNMDRVNQLEHGKDHIDNLHRDQIYPKRFKMRSIVHKLYKKQ